MTTTDLTAGIPLTEVIRRFLEARGVDVDAELRGLEYARRQEQRDTRALVEDVRRLASRVKRAHREWDVEMTCWRNGWSTATLASVRQRQGEYEQLRSMFREACCNDVDLIAAVMREA